MMSIPSSSVALVTGANGYVAGWIVKELLDAGVTVHAAVRDAGNTDKTAHFRALAGATPDRLRFFKADLLDKSAYVEAMTGCDIVFHTASPFTTRVKNPQQELIDPALLGTRNVLEQAAHTPSVRRVVLTSSCAAIYADATDCQAAPGGVLTESVWNTTASLSYQPYAYSKTLAEQEAWRVARAQTQWDLVVLNPSLVIGPALQARPGSGSFELVQQLGNGTLKRGAPRVSFGAVDVRDLARAHLAAAYTPEAEGRHIISAHETDFLSLGLALLDKYGARYPLPHRALPKWLVWLVGPLTADVTRKYIARSVNVPWHADNRKGMRVFGLKYRSLKESMEDMFEQMIAAGAFQK